MEGEQTDYIWGVLDFVPDTDLPDIRIFCAVHSHNGSCMVIPREGDTVRLYVQLSDADVQDAATGRVDKSKFSPERLLDVARRSLSPFTIAAPRGVEWWTLYIIGQRVASKYSVQERVFIAGDACHTHSPKAGQGMNASINDSHDLAWKLTHVIRGWAGLSLLKTYEFERRKYAQDLIAFDKRWSALFSGKPRTDEDADGVTHEEFLEALKTSDQFMSGIGVYYAPSVLTRMTHQASAHGLVIGQRLHPHIFVRAADARPVDIHDMLPADGRFGVAVFAGDADTHLATLAHSLDTLLRRHADQRGGVAAVFNVFTVLARSKDDVNYTDVPELLRPHWSKVLLDDTDMFGRSGGGGYDAYGIDRARGAVVIVRPDGFVGTVAPLEDLSEIDEYFSSFMVETQS
ncbi:thioredoxin-like protein [Wolfiporia cocos MD-104 SS10]|uniref:Thioredoxin-like protein n=1 Tax=Wolfiporia cocos (strain MD-104) TaxID=742152 RepID=A0A2H3JCE7_WOLCO|nr:thioredoxin-like protein [Wolfiporia cocos MD-104 SS10]